MTSLPTEIADYLEPEALTGCLLWSRSANSHGYGVVWHEGRVWGAHRLVYFLTYGPTPLRVLHKCFTKLCAAPWHLQAGTARENALDADVVRTGTLTHCLRGHERTPENTNKAGACKMCRAQDQRKYLEVRRGQ